MTDAQRALLTRAIDEGPVPIAPAMMRDVEALLMAGLATVEGGDNGPCLHATALGRGPLGEG